MSVRRIEHQDRQVTYYLHTEYGYGDTMEVTPKDMMALGAWLLEHEQVVVEDAIRNDVLQAQPTRSRAGRMTVTNSTRATAWKSATKGGGCLHA